ncbi:MAG TPA: YciI family protein [Chitinophaga sp.]|uniref:YciI family protein n=1 Tax=Chitinophaga sp. TaxID=1869181 RepID=UPI002DB7AA29|nr:YciI family protein [Chitinophaga sp.]HEU4553561.1 YciI family protein [Chitinophaga sp.]
MSSKIFPALLLTGFLVLLIVSFKPTVVLQAVTGKSVPDTSKVVMKQYWMVFLKKGPRRNQSAADAAIIQEKHLANINRLAASGKLLVAGPFGDDGDLRGIFILDCPDSASAAALVRTDTAVQTGRLTFDVKSWWTARNCVFK